MFSSLTSNYSIPNTFTLIKQNSLTNYNGKAGHSVFFLKGASSRNSLYEKKIALRALSRPHGTIHSKGSYSLYDRGISMRVFPILFIPIEDEQVIAENLGYLPETAARIYRF